MSKRPVLTAMLAAMTFATSLVVSVAASEHAQVSLFNKQVDTMRATLYPSMIRIAPEGPDNEINVLDEYELEDEIVLGKEGEWTFCDYTAPEEAAPAVDLIGETITPDLAAGDKFEVEFTFENIGNTRLFAQSSNCDEHPYFSLVTQNPEDHVSVFGEGRRAIDGWANAGRIEMETAYADPGEQFTVSFSSRTPDYEENNIYREFFAPIIDGNGTDRVYVDAEKLFAFDVEVGEPTEQMRDDMQFVLDLALSAADLEGLERNLETNLSSQTMYAKFGDLKVWSMPTSTGAWDTPTPPGYYTIFQKQELRIGGKWPHYRMPYWQYWDARGYGIHGLPYLANDNGVFWTEAENHMGIPVSHGCIRTLDRDAEALYRFTDIGTPIWIHY